MQTLLEGMAFGTSLGGHDSAHGTCRGLCSAGGPDTIDLEPGNRAFLNPTNKESQSHGPGLGAGLHGHGKGRKVREKKEKKSTCGTIHDKQ